MALTVSFDGFMSKHWLFGDLKNPKVKAVMIRPAKCEIGRPHPDMIRYVLGSDKEAYL